MVEIDEVQRQVDTWNQFRDVGSHMHEMQIRILEQELKDMQNSFDEMSSEWQGGVVSTFWQNLLLILWSIASEAG